MRMRGQTREVGLECKEKQEKYDENVRRNKRSRMKINGESSDLG